MKPSPLKQLGKNPQEEMKRILNQRAWKEEK